MKLWLSLLLLLIVSVCHAAVPPCFEKLEKNFFRTEIVMQAFSFHLRLNQLSWTPINNEISKAAKKLPEMIDARAKKMQPNPLDITYIPSQAERLFEEAALEILTKSLGLYNISDKAVVSQVYEYIKSQQINEWNVCFSVN